MQDLRLRAKNPFVDLEVEAELFGLEVLDTVSEKVVNLEGKGGKEGDNGENGFWEKT